MPWQSKKGSRESCYHNSHVNDECASERQVAGRFIGNSNKTKQNKTKQKNYPMQRRQNNYLPRKCKHLGNPAQNNLLPRLRPNLAITLPDEGIQMNGFHNMVRYVEVCMQVQGLQRIFCL